MTHGRTPRGRISLLGTLALMAAACGGGGGTAEKTPDGGLPTPEPGQALVITPQALARFLEVYVAEESGKGGGWLEVPDPATGADLRLKLRKVHDQDMVPIGPDAFSQCADMGDESGRVYDVDFLVKKTARGVDVTEVLLHRTPDAARYEWVEEQPGQWIRKPG